MSEPRATVLLDLDDTLLHNEMGVFLPAYFQAIQVALAEVIPGDGFMDAFLEASRRMMVNDRPDRTLADAFWDYFPGEVGVPRVELEPVFERFYLDAYPKLRTLTAPLPGARAAVEALHAAGHTLVVATNPLFPPTAIHQRVDWAGLGPATRDFDLVTTFERFHHAKPDPAYYAEIMAYLGWPDGPAVMVGNDPVNDIRPARALGLATYLVPGPGSGRPDGGGDPRHGSGPLADFPAWLAGRSPAELEPEYRSAESALAVLKSTVSALQTLARETPPSAWQVRRDGEWSPLETLVHLRDVELAVNRVRAESFLSDETPFIAGVDTDSWYADGFGDLPERDKALDEFIRGRLETLAILSEIPPESWDLPARHSIFGPTDLREIVTIMAGHDRNHMRPVREALAPATRISGRSRAAVPPGVDES